MRAARDRTTRRRATGATLAFTRREIGLIIDNRNAEEERLAARARQEAERKKRHAAEEAERKASRAKAEAERKAARTKADAERRAAREARRKR